MEIAPSSLVGGLTYAGCPMVWMAWRAAMCRKPSGKMNFRGGHSNQAHQIRMSGLEKIKHVSGTFKRRQRGARRELRF